MADIKHIDCIITIKNETETLYKDPYKPGVPGHIRNEQNGDRLVRDTIERLNDWVASEDNPFTREELELLGRHLFYLLFDDALSETFQNTYAGFKETADKNARLRLVLMFHKSANELASYPWEFLYMPAQGNRPGFFLSAEKRTELILTRFVPELGGGDLYPEETDLRILVAFSNPRELGGKLDPEVFLKHIQGLRRQMQVRVVKNQTEDMLAEAIRDFPPHIFHFIGHGDASRGVALMKQPSEIEEHYDLTGNTKDAEWKDSRGLVGIFSKFGKPLPRLVFLHACEGAAGDSLRSFNSTARDLVYSYGIPAVVAMQYVITNEAAGQFAETFYQQLADGKTIDVAVTEGRWALRQTARGEWGDRVFGTPLVYLQSDTAIVLHQREEEAEEKPQPCPYIRAGVCKGGVVYSGDEIHIGCRRPRSLRPRARHGKGVRRLLLRRRTG